MQIKYEFCLKRNKLIIKGESNVLGEITLQNRESEYILSAIEIQKKKYDDIILDTLLNKFLSIKEIDKYYKMFDLYINDNISCVYFVENKKDGSIKIGKTIDIGRRMYELEKMGNNFNAEILLKRIVLCTDNEISKIEAYMHNFYKNSNVHGEWFNIKEYSDKYFNCKEPYIDEIYVDFSFDNVNYNLKDELYNLIERNNMIRQILPVKIYIDKPYKNSKIYKLYQYLYNKNIGFHIENNDYVLKLNENIEIVDIYGIINKIKDRFIALRGYR